MTQRPNMSGVGLANVRRLIRLADAGNGHAAAWLREIARREHATGCAIPAELADWLLKPAFRRGRGNPTDAAKAATVDAALAPERIRETAAWAAWWNVEAGMPTTDCGDAGPAFQDVSAWLKAAHGVEKSASAVRTWYYAHLAEMKRDQARVAALRNDLN